MEKQAQRFRPRRRPVLKLVASEDPGNRHVCAAGILNFQWIVEVWTFAEWEACPDALTPESFYTLPGIGFMDIRRSSSETEYADARDVSRQAYVQYYSARGYNV